MSADRSRERRRVSAYAGVLERLAERTGAPPRGPDGQRMARCPAHEDRAPSLSVSRGEDGRVLLHCHARCNLADVLAALELTPADLFDDTTAPKQQPAEPVVEYPYTDEHGGLLFVVERQPGKRFRQRRPDGRGGWTWRLGDVRRVLYRLPEVIEAVAAGRTVYVVEGEKDVAAAELVGATATCNAGGAGKWRDDYAETLAGAHVIVVSDRDEPGRKHATRVASSLAGKAASVRVMVAATGKDLADHLAAGHTLDELVDLDDLDDEPGFEDVEPVVDPDEEWERQAAHNRAVAEEVRRLRVREDAARRLRSERASALPTPTLLSDFLAVPDPEQRYRIDRLWPVGGRIVLAAQYKAGKTTTVGNLVRCLADGDPFLGAFDVDVPDGTIVLFDDELDETMLRRWLRDQGVQHPERVVVVSLRGRIASLDLLDVDTRGRWVKLLVEHRAAVVILDCLRPALDALGLSEDKEAGQFLVAFDAMLTEAGVREAVVTHHMGHSGERARGASQLRDWPDAEWRLVREKDDDGEQGPDARRYLTAYGRDVDLPESLLGYDPATRRLTVEGGTRKDTAADAIVPDILAYLAENPGVSQRQIETGLQLHKRADVRTALHRAVAAGQVDTTARTGRGGGTAHFLAPVKASAPTAPELRQRTTGSAPVRLKGGALPEHGSADELRRGAVQADADIWPPPAAPTEPTVPRQLDQHSESSLGESDPTGLTGPTGLTDAQLAQSVQLAQSDQAPTRARAKCTRCGFPLDPVLAAHGETTHPGCAA